MTVPRIPARQRIKDAQDTLLDLTSYVTANSANLDVTHVQLLASKILSTLEAAHGEIQHATCDAETALRVL